MSEEANFDNIGVSAKSTINSQGALHIALDLPLNYIRSQSHKDVDKEGIS